MAPPVVPDPTRIVPFPMTVNDLSCTVYPNGTDDRANLQYALDNLAGKTGAQLNLVKGAYYSSYQLNVTDNRITIQGGGALATILTSGTPTSVIEPLDAADQATYNPTGVPVLLQTMADTEDAISLRLRNVGLSSSNSPGHEAYGSQFSFTDPNYRNAELRSLIYVSGKFPNLAMNNVALDLQDGVATPCGSLNLIQPQLRDAIDVGTVRYTEGVDYTVNRALGTFTAILGGAITPVPGTTRVYAHWNDINNGGKNQIARSDLDVEECLLRGVYRDVLGGRYTNVDEAIKYFGSTNYGPDDPGQVEVFHDIAYLDVPDLDGKQYSQEGTRPLTGLSDEFDYIGDPACGTIRIVNTVFQNCSFAFHPDSLERIQPTGSPYDYLVTEPANPTCTVEGNYFFQQGADFFGFPTIFLDSTSGVTYAFNNNRYDNCFGAIETGLGQAYGPGGLNIDVLRLPGWVGVQCNTTITNNSGIFSFLGIPLFLFGAFSIGSAIMNITRVHSTVGLAPPDTETVLCEDNDLEFLNDEHVDPPIRPYAGIIVNGLVGPVVRSNKLTSRSPNQVGNGFAILAGTATFEDNDLSEWQMRPEVVDYFVDTGSTDSIIVAKSESDTIRDNGTNTQITGGTVIP